MEKSPACYNQGKGDSDPTSSYKPLCMLAGKLFEKLIRSRLNSAGGLSPRQYSFRKEQGVTLTVLQAVELAITVAEFLNCK
ncbi:hypothetical protein J6590_040987 [Homalodisca vitripennis]|nr:hypothetical protein J6590_040987 [Homalodisca vitripennis]